MKPDFLRSILPLALGALLLAAGGCGEDGTSPDATLTQDDADDLAAQVASVLAVDNGGTLAILPIIGTPETTTTKALETTVPADTTLGSLQYRYRTRFYNEAGDTMAAFDPVATVRLQTTLEAEGEITTVRYQAMVQHRSQFEARGVNADADTLCFDGAANDTCQSTFCSLDSLRTCSFRFENQAQIQNLYFLKPVEDGELPAGGVMTWAMEAWRYRDTLRTQLEAHIQATVTVRFAGGQYADLDVTGGYAYRLNLRTGELARI